MSQHTHPATVTAPASKSMSHRAMMAAALADGESHLFNVLDSDDLIRTADALRESGSSIAPLTALEPGAFAVLGQPEGPDGSPDEDTPTEIDVAESGTTCRLITAILAAGQGSFRVHGKGRMHERPIGALAQSLETLGVRFKYEGTHGCPPFVLTTDGLRGREVSVDISESSQYLSGLLLAAPLADGPLTISLAGEKTVSWPYVSLTLQMLEEFGIPFVVEVNPGSGWQAVDDWRLVRAAVPGKVRFRMEPATYRARKYVVEGDWSNASYFLAAGAVGPALVRVRGLVMESLQGDSAIIDILQDMGAEITWERDAVTVEPRHLHGIERNMSESPDIVPTVAVLAAMADGPTRITGVPHLRIKESDRLAACAKEISKVGASVMLLDDGIMITPKPISQQLKQEGVDFSSHGDHRIAMSLSLFERVGLPVRFDDPTVVNKSFPGFWDEWDKLRNGGGV
ncbi:3-phosphoshikimate 1-carboxyvinyltransferase [Oceanidesulfovibrio marinus]|uniref:3-phosphoshikimate 1-carboxyvinyltransferase n=1 Tax=Oceanidesulfovibrio marinus TaxID=370038 RepID=A0A6P1ZK97_9BACT|nr:3-phosphoshikimate 1-carboxyvinyltransferase [Oceanidesulfovibrio marinus]TVM36013.1 3-phosphoshikimate 1-carboxyvinyltransferase [Oceanidesulfovibrio marinus]